MATDRSLKTTRDAILTAYVFDVLDDYEFALLYDINKSREIFPYWKYDKFDLRSFDEAQCRTEFRFIQSHINELAVVLNMPDKIVTQERLTCTGLEGLCILLKRLAFPCRYTDMVPLFGRNQTELCLIFNHVLNFVYDNHQHRLSSWNQWFLLPHTLQTFCESIHNKGAPLQNCFGFIDGTVIPICRPGQNHRIVYNGHKRVHAQIPK